MYMQFQKSKAKRSKGLWRYLGHVSDSTKYDTNIPNMIIIRAIRTTC